MSTSRLAQAVDPDHARQVANDILSDRRFHRDPAPRPLRGPLHWLGDRLSGIERWIGDRLAFIPGIVWIMLALLVVGAVIARVDRRVAAPRGERLRVPQPEPGSRARHPKTPTRSSARPTRPNATAISTARSRLRFRAGLLRLGDRGAIAYRPSVTTGEVRRALGSENFDELARAFERVTYGGRAAEPPDLDAARTTWPRVLDEARASMSRRVWIVIGAIVGVIVVLNLLATGLDRAVGGNEPSGVSGSSYTTGGDGLAAYASLLGRFGHPVTRSRGPIADAAARHDQHGRRARPHGPHAGGRGVVAAVRHRRRAARDRREPAVLSAQPS